MQEFGGGGWLYSWHFQIRVKFFQFVQYNKFQGN